MKYEVGQRIRITRMNRHVVDREATVMKIYSRETKMDVKFDGLPVYKQLYIGKPNIDEFEVILNV